MSARIEARVDRPVADLSAKTALIAVQGPAAQDAVSSLVPADQRQLVADLKYYACTPAVVAGIDVLLARTGYTGEDGFELYVPGEQSPALWTALLDAVTARGGTAAGLACRDTLRLEAGMALYGHELTMQTNPYEAGLGKVEPGLGGALLGRENIEHRPQPRGKAFLIG